MEKTELLSTIETLSSQKLITKEELVKAFEKGDPDKASSLTREIGVSEMFYFIGGLIVFIGIAVLISLNWNTLNSFSRIMATLGFGVVAYFLGVILNKEEKYGALGYAFHLMAALTIPLGLAVLVDLAGQDYTSEKNITLISGAVCAMYIGSYFLYRKTIFTFFSIAFATWFFVAVSNFLVGSNPFFGDLQFYEYRFLIVGLSYMLLGYYFSSTLQKALTAPLYGFGCVFFLSAALALGGWKEPEYILWEIAYPVIIYYILFFSIRLKTKTFLTFGSLFLIIFIIKITSEYFTDSLGWPISLMLCGIALIAIGYYAFFLNKKYFSK